MSSTDARVLRALLSVDGAGDYLLLAGASLVLGHQRGNGADLGFLADVGALHARLMWRDSFRDGPRWEIAPLAGERVQVAGCDVGPDGVRLEVGDEVRLGKNLSLHFSLPDPASESALLALSETCPSSGPRHFLLLGEGEGGRVRIGAGDHRHVRVPGLLQGVTFQWRGDRLEFQAEGVPEADGVSLPFPPPSRIDLTLGRFASEPGRPARPPFGLAVSPHPEPA